MERTTGDSRPSEDETQNPTATEVTLDSLVRAVAATPDVPLLRPLEPGNVIDDAFEIEKVLGQGGMGTVYLARDRVLQRRVAVKVHRRGPGDHQREELLAEAQAMAQLNHPNVVAVNRVGTVGGGVYIAMEFVEGTTLRGWLRAKRRSWREIVAMFIPIAHGLGAAHAAGLVHRDFKPANVLVGSDGRPRVADFGLARGLGPPPLANPGTGGMTHDSSSGGVYRPTQGALRGTPAFMSPEQVDGQDLDGRSDQYSFCVALYESVYGVSPYEADSTWDYVAAISAGAVRPPPVGLAPRWLENVIMRGLSLRPAERFEDMEALAGALARGARRRRFSVLAGAALVAGGGVVVALVVPRGNDACDSIPHRFDERWDRAHARAIQDAIRTADVPAAATYADELRAELDGWVDRWTREAMAACVSTEAIAGRRMDCLQSAAAEFESIVGALGERNPLPPAEAEPVVLRLPWLSLCEDQRQVGGRLPPPPDPATAHAVRGIRADLARADVLSEFGKHAAAIELCTSALARARDTGYRPVEAEALLHLGDVQGNAGHYTEALEHLDEAFYLATEEGYDRAVVDVATVLVATLTDGEPTSADGDRWLGHLRAAMERLGDSPEERVGLLNAIASLEIERGNTEGAAAPLHEALEILERQKSPDTAALARGLQNLAIVRQHEGDYQAAYESVERALAIEEEHRELSRENIAHAYHNLGTLALNLGWTDKAIAHLQEALRRKEEWLGPDHPDVASTLDGLGGLRDASGDREEALRLFTRGLEIRSRHLGPRHIHLAESHTNLASVLESMGRIEESVEHSTEALEILEATVGPEHPRVALTRNNLGYALQTAGRYDEAERQLRTAVEVWETSLGPEHPLLPNALVNLGNVLRLEGRLDEALPPLRRALRICETQQVGPALAGEVRLRLGQVLRENPARRGEADAVLGRAREDLTTAGALGAALLAELRELETIEPQ